MTTAARAATIAGTIEASAPGKVVLWGEYAVLAGAPALAMAVERRARCTLEPADANWSFETAGFDAPAVTTTVGELRALAASPASMLVAHLIAARAQAPWPDALRVRLCTRALHDAGAKLGLGSSAALTVACQAALATALGQPPDLAHALAAHRSAQGGGSGIDVATAFHGGLVRFQDGRAGRIEVALPEHVFVWSGRPASTRDHLARFARYRAAGDVRALTVLGDISSALFESADIDALQRYAMALRTLDEAGGLGIWSEPHRMLASLASAHHLVYKPCGAGGGDLGVAFAPPGAPFDGFRSEARRAGFTTLQLESADHGVQVST